MPTLVVRRDSGYADTFRAYRILLDGVCIGRLARRAELRREIPPGPHRLEARIDWCGSPVVTFDADAGERVATVRSTLRGWRLLLALPTIVFFSRNYLSIAMDDASGR